MTANDDYAHIWNTLLSALRVVVPLHRGPDGDMLGASTAMQYALACAGQHNVVLFSVDPFPYNLQSFLFAKDVQMNVTLDEVVNDGDVILCLDTGHDSHIADFTSTHTVINIDHHATNNYYGTLNYIDSRKGSCCSVLLDFFEALHIAIDKELATRLLLGVCADSSFFRNKQNTVQSMRDALKLIDCGAEYYDDVVLPYLHNTPVSFLHLVGVLYERIVVDDKLKCAYVSLSKKDLERFDHNFADLRLLPNYLIGIAGVDYAWILIEVSKGWKGSFRTHKNVDVSVFAQALGGGGHKPAAAFFLEPMEEAAAVGVVLEMLERTPVGLFRKE